MGGLAPTPAGGLATYFFLTCKTGGWEYFLRGVAGGSKQTRDLQTSVRQNRLGARSHRDHRAEAPHFSFRGRA